MNDRNKYLLFGLMLAGEVIGSFVGAVVLGLYLDSYFKTRPIIILCLLVLAFIYVMRLLLGVRK